MSLRRTLLRPLVPVYAAALAVKRGTGRLHPRRQHALSSAVISIGSVSAGGAGKTPFVLLLADILKRRNYAVSILTRGYGRDARARKSVERVDPAGDAARFGDEPLLLARRSGAPVYVGTDRYRAGLMAEALTDAANGRTLVHLLDDGFQHRALARDIDIVLLTCRDIGDVLLPAGNLREPLVRLREADILVLRDEEALSLAEFVAALSRDDDGREDSSRRELRPPLVWTVRRSLDLPPADSHARPKRPLVFCGIARPEGFIAILTAAGIAPAATTLFADHHRYRERDLDRLLAAARANHADGFVTTEKDAVKLSSAMRRKLEQTGPLLVPELRVELLDEREAMEQLVSLVARLDRRRRR